MPLKWCVTGLFLSFLAISIDGLKNFRVFNRRYRNRRIGDFLKEMHLTEGRNTGFGKILRALERNGSPKPLFETDDIRTFFATTIYIHPGFTTNSDTRDVTNNVPQNVTNNVPDSQRDLSKKEAIVLQLIKENPNITVNEIAEKMNVVSRTAKRYLYALKEKGYILRDGTKNGKWIAQK